MKLYACIYLDSPVLIPQSDVREVGEAYAHDHQIKAPLCINGVRSIYGKAM